MGKRRQQPVESRTKRLRTNRSESSESRPSGSSTPMDDLTPSRALASVGETESRTNDSLSAVEQLTNVMREVFSNLSHREQRPSTSTGFRGDAVPYFDPEDSTQDIMMWCGKIDELRGVFNWSEDATIYYALAKLKGLAQTWYRSLSSVKYSWSEWKEKLQRAFPSSKDFAERLEEMMKRKKKPWRNLHKKLSLIHNCGNISGSDAVACIIHGLQDDHVKTSARGGNYAEPEELFTYLRTVKNVPSHAKEAKFNSKKSYIDKMNRGKSDGSSSSGLTCFTCGKSGHKSFQCKSSSSSTNRFCTFCHKKDMKKVGVLVSRIKSLLLLRTQHYDYIQHQ
ncbi:hypothetical protein NQ318_018277 [Aromia moschata]|uniref:CCHC-type domain-containing protein n=1 Tax=Aromia moschata TaxID=1265417 RepID=A0AAV8ZFX6_9CUCU|nr:hypothetical protein NQ318_018277 [Aromia moschata]